MTSVLICTSTVKYMR